jgi:hypothetical protein
MLLTAIGRAAGALRRPEQTVVPKVSLGAPGSRWAATDRCTDHHDPYRSVTDRGSRRAVAPLFTCRFPMILTGL